MRRHVVFVLFVFLMSLFSQTFLCAQESDDSSDDSTTSTLSSRQRRGRCPPIRDSLRNGWVRMRNRGRIAKFTCIKGFQLIGNRVNTCIQGKWAHPIPVCQNRFAVTNETYMTSISPSVWTTTTTPRTSSVASISSPLTIPNTSITWSTSITQTTAPTVTSSTLSSLWTQRHESSTETAVTDTTKFVSSVININWTSSDGTSLSADDNKTPITELTLDNNASTNTTNIIQEVSTLTTTTTPRSNALKSKFSSTEPTLEIELTTLLSESATNDSNILSTNSAELSSIDLTQDVTPVLTSTPSLPMKSTPLPTIPFRSSPTNSMPTTKPIQNGSDITNQTEISSTTVSSLTTESITSDTMPVLVNTRPDYRITEDTNVWRSEMKTNGTTIGSTKSAEKSSVGSTTESTTASKVGPKSDYNRQKNRFTFGIRPTKQTTVSIRRNTFVETTKPSERTTTIKNALFEDNKTITPLRRRRQKWNTKTGIVITSNASESAQSQTKRVITISMIVILMTILTTSFSLYLIRKLRTDRRNRLSDDSEMLYLSSNEVL